MSEFEPGDGLKVVDEVLTLLVGRAVAFQVKRREAGLPVDEKRRGLASIPVRLVRTRGKAEGTHGVLGKLVQPKDVVVSTPRHPKLVHPAQQVVPTEKLEGGCDNVSAGKGEDGLGFGPSLSVVGRGFGVVPARWGASGTW